MQQENNLPRHLRVPLWKSGGAASSQFCPACPACPGCPGCPAIYNFAFFAVEDPFTIEGTETKTQKAQMGRCVVHRSDGTKWIVKDREVSRKAAKGKGGGAGNGLAVGERPLLVM